MFEEPEKELQELEKELHDLEQKDNDFEDFYAKIVEEFGENTEQEEPAEQSEKAPEEKAPAQEQVNGETISRAYADKQKKAAPVKKDNSIRNLTILIILELLGIAGVVVWWLLQLL